MSLVVGTILWVSVVTVLGRDRRLCAGQKTARQERKE